MGSPSGIVTLGFFGGPLVTLGFGSTAPPPTVIRLRVAKADHYRPGAPAATSYAVGCRAVEEYAPGFRPNKEREDEGR